MSQSSVLKALELVRQQIIEQEHKMANQQLHMKKLRLVESALVEIVETEQGLIPSPNGKKVAHGSIENKDNFQETLAKLVFGIVNALKKPTTAKVIGQVLGLRPSANLNSIRSTLHTAKARGKLTQDDDGRWLMG